MKKVSTATEWADQDWETLRFAPAIGCADEYIKDFAIFGFGRTLEDFSVGAFEGSTVAAWYWKASRFWPRKGSQSEFNKYARARISDFVGYTRRRGDAFHVVDRLFDKARFLGTTLEEVINAVTFLSPTKLLPSGTVHENGDGDSALVDLTRRKDSPKLLKIDLDFLPTLKRLYPFERIDEVVLKHIPVGETATREFSLVKLAWWSQNPNTTLEEMDKAIGFRNGDKLDWTKENLFSKWKVFACEEEGVPAEFPEFQDSHGDTRTITTQYVGMLGADLPSEALSKPTKTARVLNWLKEAAR
jgi:hypothetical protein